MARTTPRGFAADAALGVLLTAALAILVLLLPGCAGHVPASPTALPSPAPVPAAAGDVLGRSDRMLVYLPRSGDTLPSIAARFLGSPAQDWLILEHNQLLDPAFTAPRVGEPLVVPLLPFNPLGVRADRYQTVPILCYHRFGGSAGSTAGTGPASKMTMPASVFAQQLDWLARNGYRVLRLADLQGFLEGRAALPQRSVVITIDDGYESVYRHAFPLLKAHGFAATLFVYTDFIGAGDALRWPQLREMAASGLVDIQAHSKTHRNLIERVAGESDERYRQGLDAEVRQPRELLERRLSDAHVQHYAYPYGDANDAVLDALQRSRYQLAVTVNPGGNAFFAQPLLLRRTMIYGDMDLEAFKLKLQTSRGVVGPGAP